MKFETNQFLCPNIGHCWMHISYNHICRIFSLEYQICEIILEWVLKTNNRLQQHTMSHPNQQRYIWGSECRSFEFLKQLWPWTKVKEIQTGTKMYCSMVSITMSNFKEIGLWAFKYKPTFFFFCFLLQNHITRILSYWSDEIKRVRGSSDQQV